MKCCEKKKGKKPEGLIQGLLYGLLPHTGCIAFIIFSIVGVSTATTFLRPLMMSASFFYWLIVISFIFATISAAIYLKKNGSFSLDGLKKKRGYLSILYGTTMGINLLLFLVIFPLVSNVANASPTGNVVLEDLDYMKLQVDIPCPGHSPLISSTLKTLPGVKSVIFSFPNYFDVKYDSSESSRTEILSLDVFQEYKPTVISETKGVSADVEQYVPRSGGCGCGGSTCGVSGSSCCGR